MSESELAEDFLPVYDVSDAVAAVVEADQEGAWQALLDVDLLKLGREAPLVGMLGALRMLPEVVGHLLHGERPAKPPESMRLRDLQHRELGETVHLHPAGGLRVSVFEPGRALGLEGWGTFTLEPVGAGRTRLIARGGVPRGVTAAAYAMLMEIPHFLMERRMLLGIKQRAEASRGDRW